MFHGHLQATASTTEGKARDSAAVARRLFSYARPFWHRMLVVLGLTLVIAATSAAGPYLIGVAIDQYIANGQIDGLSLLMVALIGVYVAALVARVLQTYIMGWLSQMTLARIRFSIFRSLQGQSLRFFDRNEVGDLMSRLVNDVEAINVVLSQGLIQALSGFFALLGMVVAMLALNFELALASFIVLPAMFFATSFLSGLARRAFRRTRETIGDVSANLQEDIAGVKVAQAFNRTDVNRARFAQRNAANRDANVGATAVTSALFPAMDVLSTISIGIIAGFGGYLAIHGQATVGVVVAFLAYVQQFYNPIQQLGLLYAQSQSALAAAERTFNLIDTPVDLNDAPDAVPLDQIEGQVEFKDVQFAYSPSHMVLDGVSFVVKPGQTIALVGATGTGKTTIANLIARFYDVAAGQVLVDGADLRTVTVASLRRQMGIVPQNSFLFAGTIAENIRYGRLDAPDQEIEAAAKLVNAHGFIIALPQGYSTVLGEKGGTLSQGQRQLIAFARAILADPRILILDEATSSVDTRTEALIQQALAVLLKGRTSFVIAHRLSTIRNADHILLIEDGQIAEQGTHRELIAHGGLYADLYRRQFRDLPSDGSPDGQTIDSGFGR
ncbi:MAG: ABC transporter ATP-binding protein [Chloroflexi bacterium]|nr:ABC transporter ATP-binding protein [Chloroflexota bacterium]